MLPVPVLCPTAAHGAGRLALTANEPEDPRDPFIATRRAMAERAKAGDTDFFEGAPYHTPRRRLDETSAARKPILRWRPETETKVAAE